jgi:hypothetical protein
MALTNTQRSTRIQKNIKSIIPKEKDQEAINFMMEMYGYLTQGKGNLYDTMPDILTKYYSGETLNRGELLLCYG